MRNYKRKRQLFPIGLSVSAAAEALGIHRRKLYTALHDGELKAYKRGSQTRLLVVDLVEWIRNYWRVADYKQTMRKLP